MAYSKGGGISGREERSFDDSLSGLGISSKGDEIYMPHYEAIQSNGDTNEYPLLLFPIAFINLASGWIGNPPFLNKTLFDHQLKSNDLFVEVNPKTAAKYGLAEGCRALMGLCLALSLSLLVLDIPLMISILREKASIQMR